MKDYFLKLSLLLMFLCFWLIQGCENTQINKLLDVAQNYEHPKTYVNSVDDSTMVLVLGNRFIMGSPENELYRDSDETEHEIHMATFYISEKEITVKQYAKFLNNTKIDTTLLYNLEMANPLFCGLERLGNGLFRAIDGREDYPICYVSWKQATEYCKWATAYLPTEAQWEFACIGGLSHTIYPWGDTFSAGAVFIPTTAAEIVSRKTGENDRFHSLFDMAGNVSEWCRDAYYADYYLHSQLADPLSNYSTYERVHRGGSVTPVLGDQVPTFRVSSRESLDYRSYSPKLGFRIVQYATLPDKYL